MLLAIRPEHTPHPAPAQAVPVIERAFAAGTVDLTVSDDWEDVQVKSGLKKQRVSPRPGLTRSGNVADAGEKDGRVEEQDRYLARRQQRQTRRKRKKKAKTVRKLPEASAKSDQ